MSNNSNYFNNDRLKKIATYTLGGTAIGAITGNNAGKGAAIGAILGTLTGGIKEIDVSNINYENPSLILFYMPTCPACIRFKPVYDELEKHFRAENIEIPLYSVNSLKSDISKVKLPEPIQYVPTLVIVPGHGKMPIVYKQNMSVNNITNEVAKTIEGGRRSKSAKWSWMMFGGENPSVEGGKVDTSAPAVEAGRKRSYRRMRGGEVAEPAVEGGRRRHYRMYGGETDVAVSGGEIAEPAVEGGRRRHHRMRGGEVEAAAAVEGGKVEAAPAVEAGRRRHHRMNGGEVEAAPVEGGKVEAAPAVEAGRRRHHRMRGGEVEAAPVEGGEVVETAVEGGRRRHYRMRGGEVEAAPVEGGEVVDTAVEGGRRHRMRHWDEAAPVEGGKVEAAPAVEGGRRRHHRRMWGGEVEAASVEGGEVAEQAVEGGRRRHHRMRGGEVEASVEGGEVVETAVEGGRRRHHRRMWGGKVEAASVEGGEVAEPAVEGGEVEISGGKKKKWQIKGSIAAKRRMAKVRSYKKMHGGVATSPSLAIENVEGGATTRRALARANMQATQALHLEKEATKKSKSANKEVKRRVAKLKGDSYYSPKGTFCKNADTIANEAKEEAQKIRKVASEAGKVATKLRSAAKSACSASRKRYSYYRPRSEKNIFEKELLLNQRERSRRRKSPVA